MTHPPPGYSEVSPLQHGREQLIIELDGSRVLLTLSFPSHYAAIETYERLLAQAREGFVLLDMETKPSKTP